MRQVRGLMPYVAAAILIAGGATAIVITSLGSVSAVGIAPADVAQTRSAPALSTSGRIAYWRTEQSGDITLWVANFDGTKPRPVTTLPSNGPRPFATRWTTDGGGVAFVLGGVTLGLVRLDGTRTDLVLAPAERQGGYRIIDHRWSVSGLRVAATVIRSDGRVDVFIAALSAPTFARATDTGDSWTGDWLTDDSVLVESVKGVLGLARLASPFRKLSDGAASPVVADGRLYYLVGSVSGNGDPAQPFVREASVWSIAPDGGAARLEMRLPIGGALRLDGRWPDGRFLMHVPGDRTQWLAGTKMTAFASPVTLQRVVVSADRRTAVGFGGTRIVRIDIARAGDGFSPPPEAFVVLLDGVIGADAWVPKAN